MINRLLRRRTTGTLPRPCIINFYQLSYFLNDQPFCIQKRFLMNFFFLFSLNAFLRTFALCWFDAPSSENDNPNTPGMIRKPAPDLLASQIPYFSHSACTLLSALQACNIWESAFWTTSDGISFSSVNGHWPPFANVAAIIAAASGVIAVLKWYHQMTFFSRWKKGFKV